MDDNNYSELEKLRFELEKLKFLIDLSFKSKRKDESLLFQKKMEEIKLKMSEIEESI